MNTFRQNINVESTNGEISFSSIKLTCAHSTRPCNRASIFQMSAFPGEVLVTQRGGQGPERTFSIAAASGPGQRALAGVAGANADRSALEPACFLQGHGDGQAVPRRWRRQHTRCPWAVTGGPRHVWAPTRRSGRGSDPSHAKNRSPAPKGHPEPLAIRHPHSGHISADSSSRGRTRNRIRAPGRKLVGQQGSSVRLEVQARCARESDLARS